MQVRPVATWRTWNPFTALAKMDRDVDEVVRRAASIDGGLRDQGRVGTTFVPPVEVVREGEGVLVRELPAVRPEDVTVEA